MTKLGEKLLPPNEEGVKVKVRKPPAQLNPKSKKYWRDNGYLWAKLEYFSGGCRHDAFGFIDALAITHDGVSVALQITSKQNMQARYKKIISDATLDEVESEDKKVAKLAQATIERRMAAGLWLTNPRHKIIIEGWYKEGSRWKCVHRELKYIPDTDTFYQTDPAVVR